MKKIFSILLTVSMLLALAACGSRPEKSSSAAPVSSQPVSSAPKATPEPTPEVSSKAEPASEAEPMPAPAAADKTLVVYYSASGRSARVGEIIAGTLGADTFELTPVTPYTDEDLDWTTDGSRVNLEHDDESLRDIALTADTVENWEEYSTVFIGYPIWWGIAAWPVNNFVKNNDFTGKTVIPFCTSASSGLGQSGTLLQEMAGTGNWLEGQRFNSGVDEEEVVSWVNGLDF